MLHARKMLDREAVRSVIQQWNANRLDLFALSEPDEVRGRGRSGRSCHHIHLIPLISYTKYGNSSCTSKPWWRIMMVLNVKLPILWIIMLMLNGKLEIHDDSIHDVNDVNDVEAILLWNCRLPFYRISFSMGWCDFIFKMLDRKSLPSAYVWPQMPRSQMLSVRKLERVLVTN